jgi:hypothetical protein
VRPGGQPPKRPFGSERRGRQPASIAKKFVDSGLGAGLGVDGLDDDGAAEAGAASGTGEEAGDDDAVGGDAAAVDLPVSRSTILVLAERKTPMERTAPSPTMTPSTTSERAPMKQLSSMIVGLAWRGSSTPPIPTPPERCTPRPIWAQLPTVAQVSTMVPSPTEAPMLTKEGIRIAFGAT